MPNNKLAIYSIPELIEAFNFYLNGPKENALLKSLLKEISQELINRPDCDIKYHEPIDRLLDVYYDNWKA